MTSDSTFTAEFTVAGGVNDTIYLEYDGKEAMLKLANKNPAILGK